MRVEVIKDGKTHSFIAKAGSNLMDLLLNTGMLEATECAGLGICGKCGVIVQSGRLATVAPVGEGEPLQMRAGLTLACRSLIQEDLVIKIPSAQDDTERKVHLKNLGQPTSFADPPLEKHFVTLPEPSLLDQTPDLERILEQVGANKKASRRLLQKLPETLRNSGFAVTAVLCGESLLDVEPGDTRPHKYGFALDIGTTTIAIYLVDLNTGKLLGAEGAANPQRVFGSDVLSRIATVTEQVDRLEEMQTLSLEVVARSMRRLLAEQGIEESFVYSVTVVGNTTMSHLFLGIDPRNLALAPFIPCWRGQVKLTGGEFGLPMHPEGEVVILPNISGYVGSDTLGVILGVGLDGQTGLALAVDIGTNGEIVLAGRGRILACSAAAGPAFEGAHIRDGMRAGHGAIEAVRLEDGAVRLTVIDKVPPQGICASGLIDAVAELLRAELIDARGRLAAGEAQGVPDPFRPRLRQQDGLREFVLAFSGEFGNERDIAITQKDIRELQLAKGAIAAGILVLAGEMGIETADIDRVFLAGAFGNYINRKNAVALGLFPGITLEKIVTVGNAAGEGAILSLLSTAQRDLAGQLAAKVHAIELSARMDFTDIFVRELNFPDPQGRL